MTTKLITKELKDEILAKVKLGESVASPWENPFQESYYGKFKLDLGLEFERFNTLGEFVESIHKTINYYNTTRIHRNLKMSVLQHKQNYIQKFLLQNDSIQN